MVAVVAPTVPSTAGRAPRHVQWRCQQHDPAEQLVATSTEMRVQRFQAPWASGKIVFALLRSAQADTLVKSRWEHGVDAVISAYDIVDTRDGRHRHRGAREDGVGWTWICRVWTAHQAGSCPGGNGAF